MLAFIGQRTVQGIAVLLVLSLIVFAGVYAIGNPVHVLIDPKASPAQVEATIRDLGLDRSLVEQYLLFLGRAVQGDFGQSFVAGRPAMTIILERLPATLELVFVAMALAVVVGFPLGLWAGIRAGTRVDQGIMGLSILGFSVPSFWLGMLLVMVFAVDWKALPPSGRGETVEVLGVPLSFLTADGLRHMLLPALNLAVFQTALVIRLTRSGVREHMRLDYVRYARAKGVAESRIMGVHVARNIMIPLVTVMGMQLGTVIAFTVVTENVFAWPGIGQLIVDSISVLDRPVILAYVLVTTAIFVVINLCVDIAYFALDPRIQIRPAG